MAVAALVVSIVAVLVAIASVVGLHDLRHSFVAVAFDRGLTAPQVAALARHANPRVTLAMYAGLTDEGREQAVAKLAEGGFGS
jgi:integrase